MLSQPVDLSSFFVTTKLYNDCAMPVLRLQ